MAWKLSGPTLYLYEKVKVGGEQKVHAFVFDVTGRLNDVKKIEVFFNKLQPKTLVPTFMHEWKDLVRPTIQFIGIDGYYGFERSNYKSFVVRKAVRNRCQVLVEFQGPSDRSTCESLLVFQFTTETGKVAFSHQAKVYSSRNLAGSCFSGKTDDKRCGQVLFEVEEKPELPSVIQSSDPPAAPLPDNSFHEPGSDESVDFESTTPGRCATVTEMARLQRWV